jgi:hypothetical protein
MRICMYMCVCACVSMAVQSGALLSGWHCGGRGGTEAAAPQMTQATKKMDAIWREHQAHVDALAQAQLTNAEKAQLIEANLALVRTHLSNQSWVEKCTHKHTYIHAYIHT